MIQVKQSEEITSARRTGALFLSRTVNVSFRLILPFRRFKPLDIKKRKSPHRLIFFPRKKKGWLTGRRRGCCVGLFVAAASVCRLCGLVRSVGFKKIFNHFFSVISEITNHGHGRE
jgi:hypothetical protein